MIFVHALGTAQIDAGETRVTPASARRFAMLLYLTAEKGRRISRSTLHELICPNQSEKNARHALRELLYQLRQAGVPLASDSHAIELRSDEVDCDYLGLLEQESPSEELVRAAHGGFLPGYAPSHSEAFTEWYEAYRAKTVFELCKALLRGVSRGKVAGDWSRSEAAARACLALDTVNEEATLALAEMLAIGGAKIRAVELLDSYMREAGGHAAALRLPAAILRARIQEHAAPEYSSANAMPFIGRGREMSRLHDAFSQAQAGSNRLVVITGEPGIGKTRLVEEFTRLAALQGATVHTVAARPHDARRPLAAFVDLVPELLRAPGALGCSPATLSTLSRLTSHPDSEPSNSAARDIHSLSYAITRALEDLLDAISHESRLVLVIEDAHWLDTHSLEAIADVVRGRYSSSLTVLVTSRERNQLAEIGRDLENVMEIPLRGLEHRYAAELSAAVLPDNGLPQSEMRTWIAEKAAGNPLFIRTLSAHYRTSGKRFEVPDSLLDLLRRRTSSVSGQAMTALTACAALGRWCSLDRFARVLEMPHADLVGAVTELQGAELVRSTADGLTVAHPLIAQALQDGAKGPDLKLTHRQVARILEAEPDFSSLPAMVWDCSHHWLFAGEQSRALALLRMCAKHAIDIGRPREAAQTLRHAASLTADREARTSLLQDAILTARLGSEFDLILECVSELRSIERLSRHDDIELCELEAIAGNYAEAAQFQDRALRCLEASEAGVAHRVRAGLMILKYADVLVDRSLSQAVQNAIQSTELDSVSPMLRFEYRLVLNTTLGNFGLAIETAREIREAQLDDLSPMERARLLYNAGLALWLLGRPQESIKTLEHAYRVAIDCGAVRLTLLAGQQLAGSFIDLGETDRAQELFHEVESAAKEVDGKHWPYELALTRVEMALARNNAKEAARLLEGAEAESYYRVTRRKHWYSAFRYRLRHLGVGKPLMDDDVRELLREKGGHAQIAGARDLEIATAIEHIHLRDSAQPREIAQQYLLSERICLAPLGIALQEALRAIGAEDLLNDWPLQRLAAAHH